MERDDTQMDPEGSTPENLQEEKRQTPEEQNIWMRGLFMVIFAILFGIAEMLLLAFAVIQFFWMLFSKERNGFLADTGEKIGNWLRDVADFQTGATDEKPFPWQPLA